VDNAIGSMDVSGAIWKIRGFDGTGWWPPYKMPIIVSS